MKSDSPIDALILKIKGQGKPKSDDYDASNEAKEIQGKKLLKAIKADDPSGVAAAVCALFDLHEPKAIDPEDE